MKGYERMYMKNLNDSINFGRVSLNLETLRQSIFFIFWKKKANRKQSEVNITGRIHTPRLNEGATFICVHYRGHAWGNQATGHPICYFPSLI